MHLAATILSVVSIVVLVVSSVMDFTHNADVVASMRRFGLPVGFEVLLGVIKVAAALGLVVGLLRGHGHGGLTVLVGWCLVAYFVLAVGFHLRAHDPVKDAAPAAVLAVVALALSLVA